MDTVSPTATMTLPTDGATNVPIDTDIVVHVQDAGGGVDQSTIVMTVEGAAVTPAITGTASDYTLTYTPSAAFGYEQEVNVTVDASDLVGNAMALDSYSFMTEAEFGNPWDTDDDDGDGIPNGEESPGYLGTSPGKKTLFVKPVMYDAFLNLVYWPGFINKFFNAAKPGFAEIPALTEVGIEVVVIGAVVAGHPYAPMQQFNYDPGSQTDNPIDFDPDQAGWQGPHSDIMVVVYDDISPMCPWGTNCRKNNGHTFFSRGSKVWSWDTKGLTPATVGPYGYKRPEVYQIPLSNYLEQGAYATAIDLNGTPVSLPYDAAKNIDKCTAALCDEKSPMNIDDADPAPNPPYTGLPDGTVEFNTITYDSTGMILTMGAMGKPFSEDEVLFRTLVHEMGHALGLAHCTNPYCIMYEKTETWEHYGYDGQSLYGFGSQGIPPLPAPQVPTQCEHSPTSPGEYLWVDGAVHNTVH